MTTKTTVKTHYQLLNVENIVTDKYQRPIRTTAVRKMADNFDKTLLGTITVSKRNNAYFVIDGQHRIALAKLVGVTSLMALVYEGLTYQEEAKYFNSLNGANGESKKPSKLEIFNASKEAKDPIAMEIAAILGKLGYTVGPVNSKGHVSAIETLEVIHKKYGAAHLFETLSLIRSTWGGEADAVQKKMMIGVSEFIHNYKGEPNFSVKTFQKQLSKIDPGKLLREADADPTTNKKAVQCQNMIWKYYNNGLRSRLMNLHFIQG